MLIPGPYGDGMDSDEYLEAINDAESFFGYSMDKCTGLLNGPMIFKRDMDAHGLEYAYDEGEGAIWDLLTVRATVSSGLKERYREELVDRLIKEYLINDRDEYSIVDMNIMDYGCGIGREALVALRNGVSVVGVDRGKTLQFADWYIKEYEPDMIERWLPRYSREYTVFTDSFDAIMCFEYFEHEPDPEGLVDEFWEALVQGGKLICNSRSFNAHDTGHLEENFHYQFNFEQIIADHGFKCLYFPWNPPNLYNIAVWEKVGKGEGSYNGATTESGKW